MKKLHLIANAHIDPIWQWDWQEGAAIALSTFRSAVELAKEYDYVFCHNEVLLYEYAEQYAPDLFDEIKKLVKVGKWHIMGGWYIQPDCNMPCGESFVRQIKRGQEYFKKKFGVVPSTAINFDPFGHTRGLVQIIKKCGQDSYLITRPNKKQCAVDDECFMWRGYDGSEIRVARSFTYRTALGDAAASIKKDIEENKNRDVWFSLWGVGNHGGGPSRKDLTDIENLKKESNFEIIHSTPETFFSEIDPNVIFDKSLQHCNPGCYVSMSLLKKHHITLENALYSTEKILSIAALNGFLIYPESELKEAERDLLEAEFHDVLPGTSIKAGENAGIRILEHGERICEKLFTKAFFSLTIGEEKAKDGEYPVFVFNPHPHKVNSFVECEFTLADQNFSDKRSHIYVYDGNKLLTSQVLKEKSSLNCDWRKRIVFFAELEPLAVKRFSVYVDFVDYKEPEKVVGAVCVKTDEMQVTIGENGLITSYKIKDKEYLSAPAFAPYMYDDNADPWGMDDSQIKQLGDNPEAVCQIEKSEGIFAKAEKVSVIEEGDVFTAVQACFAAKDVKLRLVYRIFKKGYNIDVHADVFFNASDKILKLHIPTVFKNGTYEGQTAFGTENLNTDGREVVAQRFVSTGNYDTRLAIINDCIYGSSFKDGTIMLSLLRGAGYCVHPMPDKPLFSDFMYVDRIDQGERNFDFRMTVANRDELENMAAEFNQKPYALNVFPCEHSFGNTIKTSLYIENPNIALSAFKKQNGGNGFIIRLFNNSDKKTLSNIKIGTENQSAIFGKYEVKTFLFEDGKLTEQADMVI
ncbi:MAG: alpha-mannosidase [Clostridia bacterium]|nr:alpha-mannosidase [Clostridia bacterium]